MFLAFTFIMVTLGLGAVSADDPPLDTTLKYIFTDDPKIVDTVINSGYVPEYAETPVPEVEENTAFRITLQNHKKGTECVERVRIYQDAKSGCVMGVCPVKRKITGAPKEEKNWVLRDELLATCNGGHALRRHSKYRFGFSNAIHVYGANRAIFKILSGNTYICHERSYTKSGYTDKELTRGKCELKVARIYTYQGYIRNLLWNIFHYST